MSKAFSYITNQGGPGRRANVRDYEMRPLTSNNDTSSTSMFRNISPTTIHPSSLSTLPTTAPTKSSPTVSYLIDKLKSTKSWDDNVKFSNRHRKEKKKIRSRFAVNVPTRLIFHLIIVFFLIPLVLGSIFLIRALFFGLKEDDEHPLHKKIPKSHLKGSKTVLVNNTTAATDTDVNIAIDTSNDHLDQKEGGVGNVDGDDTIENNHHSNSNTLSFNITEGIDEPNHTATFVESPPRVEDLKGVEINFQVIDETKGQGKDEFVLTSTTTTTTTTNSSIAALLPISISSSNSTIIHNSTIPKMN